MYTVWNNTKYFVNIRLNSVTIAGYEYAIRIEVNTKHADITTATVCQWTSDTVLYLQTNSLFAFELTAEKLRILTITYNLEAKCRENKEKNSES